MGDDPGGAGARRADAWSPAQYERFAAERAQPFYDLLAMVRPARGMNVIDLGCGTGELTAVLADALPGATVRGVDNSPAMLARAAARPPREGLAFELADIAAVGDLAGYDLVFSNAALQWVPDNESLLARALSSLRPGAQVAVQVPKNAAHPSHVVAERVASRPPFRDALGGFVARSHALTAERYAELLWAHGFREHACLEKIYGHELARTDDVVEWVRGTLLTAYLSRLDAPTGEAFLRAYREELLATLGDRAPYFYPFRRLLFWGRKG